METGEGQKGAARDAALPHVRGRPSGTPWAAPAWVRGLPVGLRGCILSITTGYHRGRAGHHSDAQLLGLINISLSLRALGSDVW
jgi:hypothetical protein